MLANFLNTFLNVMLPCLNLKSQGKRYVQQPALKELLDANFALLKLCKAIEDIQHLSLRRLGGKCIQGLIFAQGSD